MSASTADPPGTSYARHFAEAGYGIAEDVLAETDVEHLRRAIASLPAGKEVKRRQGVYGVRNLLEICPEVRDLACDARIRSFVTPILGEAAFAVRAVFFDKLPGANWSLYWHQDNVIAVQRRVELPGFTGWSNKAGVWQVQPPVEVLGRMVAVRIHLDDCDGTNGPLRVLPGSHRHGWLDDDLAEWKARVPEVACLVRAGGVVVMSPLTLHASAAAEAAGHRRVIHLEYASEELPGELDWHNRVR
ncbi:MAG: phytanoyl-CoA dioxygenase family protein [Planctomycetia bacterium]|nr:phytanoyl-CoA dioxygenase family protein [Planctomycetia bacterium]